MTLYPHVKIKTQTIGEDQHQISLETTLRIKHEGLYYIKKCTDHFRVLSFSIEECILVLDRFHNLMYLEVNEIYGAKINMAGWEVDTDQRPSETVMGLQILRGGSHKSNL